MRKAFGALGKSVCYILLFEMAMMLASCVVIAAFSIAASGVVASATTDASSLFSAYPDAYSDVTYLSGILTLPLVLFFVFLFAQMRRQRLRDTISFRAVPLWMLLFPLLLGVCLQMPISTLLSLIPIPNGAWDGYEQIFSQLNDCSLFGIIDTVLIAPVLEEIIFRGLVFDRLNRTMPCVLALLLQGAVFGAVHGNWIQGVYAGVFGVLLGLVYLKFRSVWAPILMHLGFNGTSYYIYLFSDAPKDQNMLVLLATISLIVTLVCGTVIAFLKTQKPKAREKAAIYGGFDPVISYEEKCGGIQLERSNRN